MLGGLSMTRDGRPLAGALAQPRRLAVLALLARGGQAGIPRDRIIATLWPDIEEERARHTFNQTLYAIRREIGDDDVILGMRELRLNTDLLAIDVVEFQSAVADRRLQRAVDTYDGPFLDGFHLPGADEFERWVERERSALTRTYTTALEQLAREATAQSDHARAVECWRMRAAMDPLDARVAIALMQSLDAAGDRLAAIQHARVYELLIDEELSLPPDREVVRFAAALRRDQIAAAAAPLPPVAVVELPLPAPAAGAVDAVEPEPAAGEAPNETGETAPAPSRHPVFFASEFTHDTARPAHADERPVAPHASRPWYRHPAFIGLAPLALVVTLATFALRPNIASTDAATPTIAVGRITDYRRSDSAAVAGSLTDLLATNLGRASGVRVVSAARMYELLRRVGDGRDTTSGAFAVAAQQAGARELVDGALYDRDGHLRLDLRRIDLTTGAVRAAYSIEAADVFTLADSGTARLIAGLGASSPPGSVADVTTRSATAYRMYEQGLRAHFRGDRAAARSFFEAAAAEDSLFALAHYYASINTDDGMEARRRLERARRLAGRASDRERLTIMAGWASSMSWPSLRAIAETLAVRYPAEVAGHLNLGIALVTEGSYLEALQPLERVMAMDSVGLRDAAAGCGACDALRWMVSAYGLADSLAAAERVARRWVRLQPGSRAALRALIETLDFEGRGDAADSVLRASGSPVIEHADALNRRAMYLIRAGDFDTADRLLADVAAAGSVREQIDAYWSLAISLRQQDRLAEALETTRRMRSILPRDVAPVAGAASPIAVLEAQILVELGRPRPAAALFDSIARGREELDSEPTVARRAAWNLTHSAGALWAAGDTIAVARLIDSVQTLGNTSGFGRDRQLHHYVRGLLLAARRDDEGAVAELRQAIVSPNFGYTRTNYELARALLRLRRAAEAVAILQPALRGSLESSNLYVSRTELHELLAQAWDSAGGRDSAAAHYRVVVTAWKRADPLLQARRARAEMRAGVLDSAR